MAMRKIIVLLVFTAMVGRYAAAQVYGDTIDILPRRPNYYYNDWWADRWLDTTSGVFGFASGPGCNLMRYNYTEEPLTVVGIAAMVEMVELPTGVVVDTMSVPESILLCDATPDSFVTVASVPFHPTDSHQMVHVFIYYGDGCCRHSVPGLIDAMPLYTYYFDKPVTVYDSFYVGCTGNWRNVNGSESPFQFCVTAIGSFWAYDCVTPPCMHTPIQKYRSDENGTVSYSMRDWYTIMLPIIQTKPPCPDVQNLSVVGVDREGAWMAWRDDTLSVGWEVAWGRAGTPPDSCDMMSCGAPSVLIDSIADSVQYVAYVRAVCEHDSTVYYGEWSEGVEFYRTTRWRVEALANIDERGSVYGGGEYDDGAEVTLNAHAWRLYRFLQWNDGDTMNPRRFVVTQDTVFTAMFVSQEGIEGVDSLDGLVWLLPNPARRRVTVLSSYRPVSVVVYDLQGHAVLESGEDSHQSLSIGDRWATTIDVSTLATGVYVVAIPTPVGIATKRLVVE